MDDVCVGCVGNFQVERLDYVVPARSEEGGVDDSDVPEEEVRTATHIRPQFEWRAWFYWYLVPTAWHDACIPPPRPIPFRLCPPSPPP